MSQTPPYTLSQNLSRSEKIRDFIIIIETYGGRYTIKQIVFWAVAIGVCLIAHLTQDYLSFVVSALTFCAPVLIDVFCCFKSCPRTDAGVFIALRIFFVLTFVILLGFLLAVIAFAYTEVISLSTLKMGLMHISLFFVSLSPLFEIYIACKTEVDENKREGDGE